MIVELWPYYRSLILSRRNTELDAVGHHAEICDCSWIAYTSQIRPDVSGSTLWISHQGGTEGETEDARRNSEKMKNDEEGTPRNRERLNVEAGGLMLCRRPILGENRESSF